MKRLLIADPVTIQKALAELPADSKLLALFLSLGDNIDAVQLIDALTPLLARAVSEPTVPPESTCAVTEPSEPAAAVLCSNPRGYDEFLRRRCELEDNSATLALYQRLSGFTFDSVQGSGCPLPAFRWKRWRDLDPSVNSAADLALLTREQVYEACCHFHYSQSEATVELKARKRCEDLEIWFRETFGMGFLD